MYSMCVCWNERVEKVELEGEREQERERERERERVYVCREKNT